MRMPQGEIVIDPFTGQSMSRDALDALLVPYRAGHGLPGTGQVPLALFLQARRRATCSPACCAT